MRQRNLKPSLFENELLGTADPLATILFAGLACMADCEGRLPDNPTRIKATIFRYRPEADVEQLLALLTSLADPDGRTLITRYIADGQRLIQVSRDATTFKKHARPHPNEPCGNYPEPPPQNREKQLSAVENHGLLRLPSTLLPSTLLPSTNIAASAARDETDLFSSGIESVAQKTTDTSQSDTSSAKAKRSKTARTDKAHAVRPCNQLFDAIAEVTASDTKASASFIGRVCSALQSADPPYTPEEVRKFAALVPAAFPWHQGQLTLGMVGKYIGIVRSPPKVYKTPGEYVPMGERLKQRRQQRGDS